MITHTSNSRSFAAVAVLKTKDAKGMRESRGEIVDVTTWEYMWSDIDIIFHSPDVEYVRVGRVSILR